jgi:hypothetical protein
MESAKAIPNPYVADHHIFNMTHGHVESSKDIAVEESFSEILNSEGYDSFVRYLGCLGLINDPNTVVLSSKHHYYYDPEELKNVNTIINLKELNQIRQIKNFLNSVSSTLQRSSNFVGYFTDNKHHNEFKSDANSYDSKAFEFLATNPFVNMIYSLMDSHVNKYMSKKNVRSLLEDHGFKVLDMTDLNGLTYFHAQIA